MTGLLDIVLRFRDLRAMCFVPSLWFILLSVIGRADRPHIIHIVADDLGWNDVSLHGSQQIPTPTIDRLASEGVVLDQFYVNPVCSPTRSSLVSGRQTIHTSIYEPLAHHKNDGLNGTCNRPGDQPCKLLPETLKMLGYRTAMVGKWHVGMYNWSWTPQARGFDFFTGYYTGAEDYFLHVSTAGGYDLQLNNEVDWNSRGQYSTELFTDRAVQVIEDHASNHYDKPLYLYLAYQSMHSPLEAPQSWIDKFSHIEDANRRNVAAMVACLDDGVHNITRALLSKRMMSQATIIFHTDNGGPANGLNGNMASNMPLRGRKGSVHEGGVRGVALVHGMGLKKTGYVNRQLIHVTDWYFSLPTLASNGLGCSSANSTAELVRQWFADQPPFLPGDGKDVWEAIASNTTSSRTEIIHVAQPGSESSGALRVGDWKLVVGTFQTGDAEWYETPGQNFSQPFTVHCDRPPSSFAGTAPGKNEAGFVEGMLGTVGSGCQPKSGACLFNIAEDPCEQQDRSSTEPKLLESMLNKLKAYQAQSISLSWQPEADHCLPQNLLAPNKGAERPCVGTPPTLAYHGLMAGSLGNLQQAPQVREEFI